MNVFGIPAGADGSGYYRMYQPFNELRRQGHEMILPDPGFQIVPADSYLDTVDSIAGQLIGMDGLEVWKRWKEDGRRLVYEVDDWIIGLDRANPSYSYFQDQAVRESFLEAVSISDAVTCTTEPLAKKLRACNDNVHVIPNCVHEEIFELPKPKRLEGAPVTVGWAGGGSHLKDFMQAAPAVRALTGGKRASMLFIGADYEPVIGHHCDYVPYQRDIWDYYKALSAIDIGLAPLATGSLGVLCKSRIRVVEYAARGIPVIATACEAYNDTVRHGETGFLVDRPDQWLEYLDELIYDSGLRESMSYNARAAAREWTIQSPANWKLWESVYGQG